MQQRPNLLLPLLVLALLLGQMINGCASEPRFLLDSDIPTPTGFQGRSLSGVKRSDGLVVAAQSIYAGTIVDAQKELNAIERRFTQSGWDVAQSSGDQIVATAIFSRNDRRCRVRVMKNELNPEMSRISYVVFAEEPAGQDTAGASGA